MLLDLLLLFDFLTYHLDFGLQRLVLVFVALLRFDCALTACMDECASIRMDGWVDGWMMWVDGWMDGRTDGWTDGWMDTHSEYSALFNAATTSLYCRFFLTPVVGTLTCMSTPWRCTSWSTLASVFFSVVVASTICFVACSCGPMLVDGRTDARTDGCTDGCTDPHVNSVHSIEQLVRQR